MCAVTVAEGFHTGTVSTEIERKFLVVEPPPDDVLGPGVHYRQGYLAGEGDVESRVRISADAAWITVKAGRDVTRTEVEVEIPVPDAEALWPHTAGRRLEKDRFRVPVDGGVAEVDRYADALAGLWTVEVEFASEEDAAAFVPPPWFGPELTHLDGWSNGALARHGRPAQPPGAS
jgi:CYTH domain-containing protein